MTKSCVQTRILLYLFFSMLSGLTAAAPVNLLAIGEGTLPVIEPPTYSTWPVINLLDDAPSSGWASATGRILDNVFVFEMPFTASIEYFEFDTSSIDGAGRGARRYRVEVSDVSKTTGFKVVASGELSDRANGQRISASMKIPGRWVRLTLADNHGDAKWTELLSFRGFGEKPPTAAPMDVSGSYATTYSQFRIRQQGTALIGCYEHDEGLLSGSVDGSVMKITWRENGGPDDGGPAILVFSPDGNSFRGFWWYGTDRNKSPSGKWNGERSSLNIGSCSHWSGSVGGEVRKQLADSGRASLPGIHFDFDSATLRIESTPVLDDIARALAGENGWQLLIEGHTDNRGAAAHNQRLSEQRAATVKAYLVSRGLTDKQLSVTGFGVSRPVADNGTELGRAQNRRVDLVKR